MASTSEAALLSRLSFSHRATASVITESSVKRLVAMNSVILLGSLNFSRHDS